MVKAVYPGSFDPITNGHLDVIERAAGIFEQVTVALLKNPAKSPYFTLEQRKTMIAGSVRHLANVNVDVFDGLLVNYVEHIGAKVVLRGLRAISDFDSEFQMATTNHSLNSNIETVFMMTDSRYAYLSSSLVRELAAFGGDISSMVPVIVIQHFKKLYI
jgi:pantetheine-phosphate adenylyltransferase